MALQPFFSLMPSSPSVNTYDPANPKSPYTDAYLRSYGGITKPASPYGLGDQRANDEIILGNDPVDPTDQNISSLLDLIGRCTINILFSEFNVTTANQYLLLFALRQLYGPVSVQFFVGADLVRTEQLSGGKEQVAILSDSRGSGVYTNVYLRLASPDYWATMGFQGMECYLL